MNLVSRGRSRVLPTVIIVSFVVGAQCYIILLTHCQCIVVVLSLGKSVTGNTLRSVLKILSGISIRKTSALLPLLFTHHSTL